jgi:hypothetical protein
MVVANAYWHVKAAGTSPTRVPYLYDAVMHAPPCYSIIELFLPTLRGAAVYVSNLASTWQTKLNLSGTTDVLTNQENGHQKWE